MKNKNYAIIKFNDPTFERETTLLDNKYKKSSRYAMFVRGFHKDGSESTFFIKYSNDLAELHSQAAEYDSWYNYPIGLFKPFNGEIQPIKLM